MDQIANMLTSIRNALAIGKKTVIIPSSKVKIEILNILKSRGYINDFKIKNNDNKINLNISLAYQNTIPNISHLKRISKPGLRIYTGYKNIPLIRGGIGIVIVSTPKGILDGQAARYKKTGGEIICEIY